MARATFYYHLKRLHKPDKPADLRGNIIDIYHSNKGRYGYRRITLALRNQSMVVNHKTVEKLRHQSGIKCQVRMKKYRSYRGQAGKIAPNVLQRDFLAVEPNKKWVTDVTGFSLFGQKRYLSPVMDLYNGEIISYTIREHPNLPLVTDMLNAALKGVDKDCSLILHSDQGWHYQHATYQKMLEEKEITQSM